MQKNLTELVFILDRSGSMSGLEADTIGGFNSMIEDALAGKIDLIVTKSVSRFARNTVDSLSTIRLLKEHNVECWFEQKDTLTAKVP